MCVQQKKTALDQTGRDTTRLCGHRLARAGVALDLNLHNAVGMTELVDLVTVFRVGDAGRVLPLEEAKRLLAEAGLEVHEFGAEAGLESAELRVPAQDSGRAEDLLKSASDAEHLTLPDATHFQDPVVVFEAEDVNAGLDGLNIHSLLEANGVPALLQQDSALPVLRVEVMVSRENEARARELMREAQGGVGTQNA